MMGIKTVKELMIGIFDYPHIPYWFSIEQAIKVIKASFFHTKIYTEPLAILVFDEKYKFLGIVTLKEILKGLENISEKELNIDSNELLSQETKKFMQKSVSDIMIPIKYFVAPDEPITKPLYLMIHFNLPLIPVLEDKKKLIGIIRMIELFDAISDDLLK